MRLIYGVVLMLLVAACSPEQQAWSPPAQAWQDLKISLETRPVRVTEGMNEFLVIANRQQRGFTNDLVVDIRTDNSKWKQAIPDGALGVYRRALPIKDVINDKLYVRLKRQGETTEMTFALAPEAKP